MSPSAEAYLLIAFLSALQFFYNTGEDRPDTTNAEGLQDDVQQLNTDPAIPSAAGGRGVGLPDPLAASDQSIQELHNPGRRDVIDNTHVLAPSITTIIEILYNGKIAKDMEEEDKKKGTKGHKKGATTTGTGISGDSSKSFSRNPFRKFRLSILKEVLANIYKWLHGVILGLLNYSLLFSFELCVIFVVVAATMHADLISFLYLALFIFLVGQPRVVIHDRWRYVVNCINFLVMAEYLVLLRLPPHLEQSTGAVAKIMGSRQCGIFAQYTDEKVSTYPYSYGQWLGLCMTDDVLILIDFVVLVLVIIQAKRFKNYHTGKSALCNVPSLLACT